MIFCIHAIIMHASSSAASASNSQNSAASSAAGSTSVSTRASGKKSSGNAFKQNATSSSTGSSSTSSKWKLVRPWQPPADGSHSAETRLEDGNGEQQQLHHHSQADSEGERDDAEDDDVEDAEEDSASSAVLASSSRLKKMHLEVVDVSSTSVSLSVFGQQPLQDSSNSTIQYLDTSLGSTSSMTNQTTANRRSRAASTSSERILSNPPQPPNISIKLNSAAWPHVFHTDASFLDTETSRHNTDEHPSMSSSSILVWGLSPGQNYHIELGVFEDGVDDGMLTLPRFTNLTNPSTDLGSLSFRRRQSRGRRLVGSL